MRLRFRCHGFLLCRTQVFTHADTCSQSIRGGQFRLVSVAHTERVRKQVPPNHDRTSSEMYNDFTERLNRACTGIIGCRRCTRCELAVLTAAPHAHVNLTPARHRVRERSPPKHCGDTVCVYSFGDKPTWTLVASSEGLDDDGARPLQQEFDDPTMWTAAAINARRAQMTPTMHSQFSCKSVIGVGSHYQRPQHALYRRRPITVAQP